MTDEIRVPILGESITEATVGRWFKQVGEAVEEDEPIVELETDKVALEVNAHVAGVLTEISAQEGETVEVGALIARIDPTAKPTVQPQAAVEATPEPAPKAVSETKTETLKKPETPAGTASVAPLSPAVRKLISEHDLDPAKISGSGKDGRITKADVLEAIEKFSAPVAAVVAPVTTSASPGAREERVPMTRFRKRIAERLKEAQNTAAMLTTFNEVDMTNVIQARQQYRDLFEKKHGVRLGFMSFFIKAAVHALKEIPAVNAEIDGDEIVYKNYYNIGVAVSTPSGLVVPVVSDADRLSFAETEKSINSLAQRAREGKIALGDLQGGTFTISNGGVFGSLLSAPILNPPQSGILGMHKIQERPVAIDGQVEIRPMMYLALSYDHRLVDGREAVMFLVRIKECVEDPNRILLDL